MINYLLLAIGVAALGLSAVSASPSTPSVQATCIKTAEGDMSADLECITSIRKHADALLVDGRGTDFQTSRLVVEPMRSSDLVGPSRDWLAARPRAQNEPAEFTVSAALSEYLPYRWREI